MTAMTYATYLWDTTLEGIAEIRRIEQGSKGHKGVYTPLKLPVSAGHGSGSGVRWVEHHIQGRLKHVGQLRHHATHPAAAAGPMDSDRADI
jgi:hypothetical protein